MESIVVIVTAVISSTGAIFAKHFLDRYKEARGRRLDEAQRIAAQRDEARAQVKQLERCREEWQAAFHSLRIKAINAGVPEEQTRPPDSP